MLEVTDREKDLLNSVLRDERAMVETYQVALQKLREDPSVTELARILVEHREAVELLENVVKSHGSNPEKTAAVWGTFVQLIETAAPLFGSVVALKALKEGEQRGELRYQEALAGGI